MKSSVSDQNLYPESEEEDRENGFVVKNHGGSDSDSSDFSAENRQQSKTNSYNTSWPQSYRQSMDAYTSVPSPNVGFLGSPTLSRLSSSFLSSTLTRRHTPEILSSGGGSSSNTCLAQPFLPATAVGGDEQLQQQRRSSHTLVHSILERGSSNLRKGHKPGSKVSHGLQTTSKCSFGQSVINGMNVLCGVGILSTPYAAKEGGWVGLSVLVTFALLSFYTGVLLRDCLDSQPGLETYPDIGQAAFGPAGRIVISIILYVELYACCIEYIILEGDNLSSLFPNAHFSLAGVHLNSHHLFALLATLVVLPTVWLRDLSVLSYISAGGVLASATAFLCLIWAGLIDDVGFHNEGTALNLSTLPVAIGLYGYCYAGHAVLPNIYSSMEKPSQFPLVLFTCFGICTLMYAGVAVTGYKMFGEFTRSQFTLNMPHNLVASKIAVWTTVVNPLTKYALTMIPVSMSMEELIPRNKSHIYSILIRTTLVISTLIVGLTIPFFGLVMALIGSLLTMLISLILPCACSLRILKGKVTRSQALVCVLIIAIGVLSSTFGTYSALSKIIESLG